MDDLLSGLRKECCNFEASMKTLIAAGDPAAESAREISRTLQSDQKSSTAMAREETYFGIKSSLPM